MGSSDSRRPAELGLSKETEAFYSGSFISRAFRALAELRELWLVSDRYNKLHVSLAVRELLASQTLREAESHMESARRVLTHGLSPELAQQFLADFIFTRES